MNSEFQSHLHFSLDYIKNEFSNSYQLSEKNYSLSLQHSLNVGGSA